MVKGEIDKPANDCLIMVSGIVRCLGTDLQRSPSTFVWRCGWPLTWSTQNEQEFGCQGGRNLKHKERLDKH